MTRAEAEAILARFENRRVLVVGDLMADAHIWGHAARVSPEAPVLVVEAERETFVPGGAANVAHQLVAFGAKVVVAGVVGDDGPGEHLRAALSALGAETVAVVASPDRPTTVKTRIVAGTQQIVRVDREKRAPLPDAVAREMIARASEALESCDAVLFSDYDKGVLSRATVQALIARAKAKGAVVTANPKPVSARFYAGADTAQFNKSEADATLRSHRFEDDLSAARAASAFHIAGERLREDLGVRSLLVTRSSEGMTLFKEGGAWTDVAPHRVEVYDGTGAGDSTIAGLTLALAGGASLDEAAHIGNASGGAVVRKVGVVAATRAEVAALFGP